MKVLHIYNNHRGSGGSDNAWADTIALSRANGIEIEEFSRSSRTLAPTLPDKMRAAVSGIYAPEAVRQAAEAVARFRPDLVHTHELYPLISPWVLQRVRRMGVPIVHTCYDYRLTCPIATHRDRAGVCHRCDGGHEYQAVLNNCRNNHAESLAYAARNTVARRFGLFHRNVSEFIVLTEFSRQWLIRDVGIPDDRITVNPCTIPLAASATDPGQGAYIGYAGRFVPEKGVEILLEAARRTGLPVKLAGDAATHPAIRPGDPVTCVLTRSRAELAAFYRGARILVVPSLWYETFGIVVAEAMSHGVPVIASRIGALRDVVTDEVTGLQVEPGSVDDLAVKMTRLWNDPALCRRLGQAGFDLARSNFSGDAHMRRLSGAYARALATTSPHP